MTMAVFNPVPIDTTTLDNGGQVTTQRFNTRCTHTVPRAVAAAIIE